MNLINTSIVILLCLYLLHQYLKRKYGTTLNRSIPFVTEGCLPFIGHVLSLARDRKTFFFKCKERYGPVFQIKLFYTTFTVLLNVRDCSAVMRNPNLETAFDETVSPVFGISSEVFNHEDVVQDTYKYFRQYLQNPEGLRPLTTRFIECALKIMADDRTSLAKNEWKTSNLLDLSRQFIFIPSFRALFGEIESKDMIEADYYTFDKNISYLVSIPFKSVSEILFRSTINARSRLAKYFIEHMHPINESKVMDLYTSCLISHRPTYSEADYGFSLTSILFASVGNTGPAVFWSLYYILRDSRAVTAIYAELECFLPKFDLDQEILIDESISEALSKCVNLDSAINETLRLMTFTFLIRKCSKETEVKLQDDRILSFQSGDHVLMYATVSHYDDDLFPDSQTFQFDRFLGKNIDATKGFMPFGGGKHMCPGRNFAKNEMKMTVALILRNIEYEFLDPKVEAEPSPSRIGIGVAIPTKDIPIRYRYKN